MNQSTLFFIIGMVGIFALVLGPTLNTIQANAALDGPYCQKKGGQVSDGPCPGGSINSPNKQEVKQTPSGSNYPPGHIEQGRR